MQSNNEEASVIDNGVHTAHSQESKQTNLEHDKNIKKVFCNKLNGKSPIVFHYLVLFIVALLSWGLLWFIWGADWAWNGTGFRIVLLACAAWAAGLTFQTLTSLPPQWAALWVGILAGNLGYVDMREYAEFDVLFRKFIPVFILGKASLMWNFTYMNENWLQVGLLGILPWLSEVTTVAIFSNLFLNFPWNWGFSFGAFYCCVSIPIILPAVMGLPMEMAQIRKWIQLFSNCGGIDVSFSVVTYGMLKSAMSTDVSDTYRYIRLVLSPFMGILVGVTWGLLAGYIPHRSDYYVNELRILIVLLGGLFMNFLSMYLDWGGTALLAVLICNATALRHWVKQGWPFLNNPAVTAYRALWSACEPAVFAYTGTLFVFNKISSNIVMYGFILMLVCLVVRLTVVFLVCWKNTIKERLFICCCWSPKAIVQAVIAPIKVTSYIVAGASAEDQQIADDVLNITIIAILVNAPLSFIATKYLAPILLKEEINKNVQNGRP